VLLFNFQITWVTIIYLPVYLRAQKLLKIPENNEDNEAGGGLKALVLLGFENQQE